MKHTMKKKEKMRECRVTARGMVSLVNEEAAQCGEAQLAQNMREQESSLQVTGQPAVVGTIAVGERLLLFAAQYRVTSRGQTVKVDGVPVVTVAGNIVGAHAMGDVIVIVTDVGLTYLRAHEGQWSVLNIADAVPQLSIDADVSTSSANIEAYTFSEPYRQWQAPLDQADVAALTSRLRAAWSALSADVGAEGRYLAPVLVRWAVRLRDGSYLWMSDPVRVGDVTLGNADRIAAEVVSTGSSFTGIEATSLRMTHYGLDITVTRGIAAEWLPLVSSIDVFVTDEAHLLTAGRSLDYRCVTRTTGGREYVLEMGLSRRSADAISRELAASSWHLVASAPVAAQVTGSDFVMPGNPLILTPSQCEAIGRLPSLEGVVCSTMAGGRLYCCTRDGDVVSSEVGNALAEAYRRRVVGAVPLSMAVVTRPLYSSGFGRYPVYVFTDDGIYAIPQGAQGALGEARLVDRTVVAAGVPVVEGGGDIWLVTRHGHLCRLNGSRLELCQRGVDCVGLAWSAAYQELWLLRSTGYPLVVMPSGRMSVRTIAAIQLYSDPRHAVAVTVTGTVLDLENETDGVMPVAWHSHPVAMHPLMGEKVHRVVWHITGTGLELTLRVTGQRGVMAMDSDVSVMTLTGAVEHPLAAPTVMVPCRSLRLSFDGMAGSGTLLLPTLIDYSS